jgi:hypothetical protein
MTRETEMTVNPQVPGSSPGRGGTLMRLMGIEAILPQETNPNPGEGPQDLCVLAWQRRHRAAQPGVGRGHHLPYA